MENWRASFVDSFCHIQNPFFFLSLALHRHGNQQENWESMHAAKYIPKLNINHCSALLGGRFLNQTSVWKRQCSLCSPVIPYLKDAFLCGSQWVPFRRIQELEGENVMQKFAINGHSDPTQTQRTSFLRERESKPITGGKGEGAVS